MKAIQIGLLDKSGSLIKTIHGWRSVNARTILKTIIKECKQCKNQFELIDNSHYRRQQFCSSKCATIYNHEKNKIKCQYCNKLFDVRNYHQWHGDMCKDKPGINLSERLNKKEISINKRLHTLKFNNKQFPNCNTKPELLFESYLNELNINYRKQEIISIWSFDFYLPDYDVYIEVDGDYWHANPEFFTKLNDGHKRRIGHDKAKNSFMLNKNKKLIRFWENEIINKKDYVINKLNIICKKSVAC